MASHTTCSLLLLVLIHLLAIKHVSSAAIRPPQSLAPIAPLTRAGTFSPKLQLCVTCPLQYKSVSPPPTNTPSFPPGPPEDHYPYLLPSDPNLGIEFHPLGLVPHRNEALVKKVLLDAIHATLDKRVGAKMPGHGYQIQEGGFLLSVGHSMGASELAWGMWTRILEGLEDYVKAYPGYDFQFQIRTWREEELRGRVIGAGFAKVR
ncbi:MAG: hypothetical protein Q9221_002999 [Calogaya cf. arnoldii]